MLLSETSIAVSDLSNTGNVNAKAASYCNFQTTHLLPNIATHPANSAMSMAHTASVSTTSL
jgi:hypothetical protein